MTMNVMPSSSKREIARTDRAQTSGALRFLAPLGRSFFVLLFLTAAPLHFTSPGIEYAAGSGVPLANVLVPLSGVLLLLGGFSVLLGYHARIGAFLLLLFLLPVTLTLHAFWTISDPGLAQLQQIHFMKNLALMGGTLLLMYFGPGPLSLDARRRYA
jgi:putative oxidoreductase